MSFVPGVAAVTNLRTSLTCQHLATNLDLVRLPLPFAANVRLNSIKPPAHTIAIVFCIAASCSFRSDGRPRSPRDNPNPAPAQVVQQLANLTFRYNTVAVCFSAILNCAFLRHE